MNVRAELMKYSLAGLLYEDTKNETYQTLGMQTAQFMGGLLLDGKSSFRTSHTFIVFN